MGKFNSTSDESAKIAMSQLPVVGQSPALFAGHEFESGPSLPDRPGVFILSRHENGRVQPILVGEGDSIVNAVAVLRGADAELDKATQSIAWMPLPFLAERSRIMRELIDVYAPQYNAERKAVVKAPVIGLPVVKLPNLPAKADLTTTIAGHKASLESEIAQLISRY